MLSCIYKIFVDFQTLIVGVIGFVGVVYTLRENALLAKKQHERVIDHEKETLRAALVAELEIIYKSLNGLAESSTPSQGAFYPEEIPHIVYKSLISKIGLLTSEEVGAVIKAYALVNELPARLKLLSVGHHQSFDRASYIFIQTEHVQTASGVCRNFAGAIVEAISALNKSKQ